MPRYHVVTLGCKLNQFDSARAEGLLRAQGYTPTADPAAADLILLNTCTVTSAADRDGRRLARRLRRLNPEARIVATGCYAERDPGALSGLRVLDAVVGHAARHTLPAALLGNMAPTAGAALRGGPPQGASSRASTVGAALRGGPPQGASSMEPTVGAALRGGPPQGASSMEPTVGAALRGGPPQSASGRAGTEAGPYGAREGASGRAGTEAGPYGARESASGRAGTEAGPDGAREGASGRAGTEAGPYGAREGASGRAGTEAGPYGAREGASGRAGTEAGPYGAREGASGRAATEAGPDGARESASGRAGTEAGPDGAREGASVSAAPAIYFEDSARGWLRVQEGCDLACSYCIIPRVRGPGRSLAAAAVLSDARALAARGVREIGLTGVNVGAWGRDLAPRDELADLLDALLAAELPLVLRLNSLEPRTVTPRIVERLASTPARQLAPHLQVPLQSGSDRVLGSMARNYRTRDYRTLLETLAARAPDICLGADVIAGFPGERDADHRETLAFVESLPLAYLHVFSYSSRPGTRAAAMPGHLPPEVARERTAELRALGAAKKRAYRERLLGRTLPALALAGLAGDGWRRTLTAHYIEVLVPAAPPGTPLAVRLTQVEADGETVRGAVA